MTGREDPPSLKDLDARLRAARAKQENARGGGKAGGAGGPKSGLGLGFRLAIDMLSGILVGIGIGLLLDFWLDAPWLLVVFFFLGAAAGMLNVYRTASGKGFAVGYRKDGDRPEDAERGNWD